MAIRGIGMNTSNIPCPCKNCTRRTVECHGKCIPYTRFQIRRLQDRLDRVYDKAHLQTNRFRTDETTNLRDLNAQMLQFKTTLQELLANPDSINFR